MRPHAPTRLRTGPARATSPTRLRVTGVGVVLAASLLSGCSSSDGPTDSSATPSPSATETSASPTPTPVPTPTKIPTPTPTASATPSQPLDARLLTAGSVPGFGSDYRWAERSTGPEQPSSSFGTCQRFSMTSVGAEQVVVRGFRPGDERAVPNDRAGELVAQFPDSATAGRAFRVLEAWRARCADRLRAFTTRDVGEPQAVPVTGAAASWYLLAYGPVPDNSESTYFDAQGAVQVGSRIAMLTLVRDGQDYDYPPGQEPMAVALRRAAQRL